MELTIQEVNYYNELVKIEKIKGYISLATS